jgi:hypothetical protein
MGIVPEISHFLFNALFSLIAPLLGDLILLSGIFCVETLPYEKNSLVLDY